MRRYAYSLVLLTFFILQMHGLGHAFANRSLGLQNAERDNCLVCQFQSHYPVENQPESNALQLAGFELKPVLLPDSQIVVVKLILPQQAPRPPPPII